MEVEIFCSNRCQDFFAGEGRGSASLMVSGAGVGNALAHQVTQTSDAVCGMLQ